MVTGGGPTKAILMEGFAFLMAWARAWSLGPANSRSKEDQKLVPLAISMVSSAETWCGGASEQARAFEHTGGIGGAETGYQ